MQLHGLTVAAEGRGGVLHTWKLRSNFEVRFVLASQLCDVGSIVCVGVNDSVADSGGPALGCLRNPIIVLPYYS